MSRLSLWRPGDAAKTCSAPSTAAFWLLPRSEKSFAIHRADFLHGLLVATPTGVYHLSRRNTKMLLHEVFGIEVSLGSISRMEAKVSKALERPSEEAHAEVVAAFVKHADATTWLMAGVTMSLWTLCTVSTPVFRIFVDGARATIESMFADERGKHHGIMISDRASVFAFWLMAMRQVCWAHLLRLFVGFSQRAGPAGTFGRELLDHAKRVFEYWQGFTSKELSRDELGRARLHQPLRSGRPRGRAGARAPGRLTWLYEPGVG